MSLIHSPENKIARPILQAVATAIKALETVTGCLTEHEIGYDDDVNFTQAKRLLWSILENNDYTIDVDTNRLCKAINHHLVGTITTRKISKNNC